MVVCLLIQTSNLFLLCFFGKLASESYEQMADYLCDFDWHGLPMNVQKYFTIMIANAQRPLNYSGYGIMELNLEKFSSVKKICP